MPYGIPSGQWAMLPPDDRNQIMNEYNAAHGKPTTAPIGGYAPGAVTAPITPNTAPSSSSAPPASSNPSWVFAVNLPSTYPDFAAMKATGAGLVVVSDDPNADKLISAARQWGVPVAIQVNAPAGISPSDYAARVATAKAQYQPDKLVLDIEAPGKGYQGSPGWDWSTQTADLLKPVVGTTSVAVTMEPKQDDYNYGAYKGLGNGSTEYWVQSYLGDMTPVDPSASKQTLVANGVDPNSITVITGPNQAPPADGRSWASWGLATSTTSAGVYGGAGSPTATAQPGTSNTPYYPGQVPIAGAGSGSTPGPPIFVDPSSGGQNAAPDGTPLNQPGYTPSVPPSTPRTPLPPGTTLPGGPGTLPVPPGGSATTPGTDWAAVFFGSLGLPPDVVAKVNEIFAKYSDTGTATNAALAYIRGTPWYATTFPGIAYGMQHGFIANEQDYRQYVTAVDTQTQRYLGRHISGDEIAGYLNEGVSPTVVGQRYAGAANVQAYGSDYKYNLGNFGDGQPTPGELKALGEEQAGLDSPLGQRVQRAFQLAQTRAQKMFEGPLSNPSLSLGKLGLSAPSLAKAPDLGR